MGFNGSHNRGESLQKQEEKIYYFGKAKIYTNTEKNKVFEYCFILVRGQKKHFHSSSDMVAVSLL